MFKLNDFSNQDIHLNLGDGIKQVTDYNYLLNKFGINEMNFNKQHQYEILYEVIKNPYNIIIVITIIMLYGFFITS